MPSTSTTSSDPNGASNFSPPIPIAIIGLAFRGPGDATNVDSLYKVMSESRETWSPIPESKWTADAFYHPDPLKGGTVCRPW